MAQRVRLLAVLRRAALSVGTIAATVLVGCSSSTTAMPASRCGSNTSITKPLQLGAVDFSSIGIPVAGTEQGGALMANLASTTAPFSIREARLIDPRNMVLVGAIVLPYTPKDATTIGPGNFVGSITSAEAGTGPGVLWNDMQTVPTGPISTGAGAASFYVVVKRVDGSRPASADGAMIGYEVGKSAGSASLNVCLQLVQP